MNFKIKIVCDEELIAIGIKEALKDEKVEILNSINSLSENEILITDRFFFNYENEKKIIMLYNDIILAAFGTEKIKLLKNTKVTELKKAVEKAKNSESYVNKSIREKENYLKKTKDSFTELGIREKEILIGILEHKTNYQIAKKLYLSEKTIKNNITVLYKKLEVKNREELQELAKKLDKDKNLINIIKYIDI